MFSVPVRKLIINCSANLYDAMTFLVVNRLYFVPLLEINELNLRIVHLWIYNAVSYKNKLGIVMRERKFV